MVWMTGSWYHGTNIKLRKGAALQSRKNASRVTYGSQRVRGNDWPKDRPTTIGEYVVMTSREDSASLSVFTSRARPGNVVRERNRCTSGEEWRR